MWLGNVPDYAVVFTQLVLLSSFSEALSAPLWTAIGATGKVQRYQLLVSLLIILDVPLVYVAFKLGMSPIIAFVINLIVNVLAYIYRLVYIKTIVPYQIVEYFQRVIVPCCIVTVFSIPIPFLIREYNTSFNALLLSIVSVVLSCMIVFLVGFDKSEKHFFIKMLNKIIKR